MPLLMLHRDDYGIKWYCGLDTTPRPLGATMNKTIGEMTPAERAAAIKRAAKAFQTELNANVGHIEAVLDETTGHFGCCDDWGTGHDDATCACRVQS